MNQDKKEGEMLHPSTHHRHIIEHCADDVIASLISAKQSERDSQSTHKYIEPRCLGTAVDVT